LQSVSVAPKDNFKTALAVSVLLHLIIALIFTVKALFFSKPFIDLSQAISVNVADFSDVHKLPDKRRDVVEEPAAKEEPQPEVKPEPAEEVAVKPEAEKAEPAKPEPAKKEPLPKKEKPPVKDEINLAKSKTKQKKALDKIKKLAALDKIKQAVTSETAKAGAKKAAKPYVVAPGTQLSGLDKIEAAEYLQSLDASIKQSWQLPQWLISKKLRTQVLVKFNTAGQLISTKVLTPSGNTTYDNYCLQAINKAAPFPKVPAKFSEKFSVDGLVVGFPE